MSAEAARDVAMHLALVYLIANGILGVAGIIVGITMASETSGDEATLRLLAAVVGGISLCAAVNFLVACAFLGVFQ